MTLNELVPLPFSNNWKSQEYLGISSATSTFFLDVNFDEFGA
jgi:hypothetical protein